MIYLFLIPIVFLTIFSGISKAIIDTISFHYEISIFKNKNELFWNPLISWKNKYKNGNKNEGVKFLGSTTIFVMFTDAWHLFGFFSRLGIITSSFLCALFNPLWLGIIIFVANYILFTFIFHIFFTYIFKKS